ncbi:hypothetical protein B484DRAFT_226905 [Ochromonadaceae sp. CCMP2298]|nr:hypothetical protein B484DRAFT_226905 [Ochromonadaceae sp. CCMP2298]
MCCLLSAICYLLSAICYLLSAAIAYWVLGAQYPALYLEHALCLGPSMFHMLYVELVDLGQRQTGTSALVYSYTTFVIIFKPIHYPVLANRPSFPKSPKVVGAKGLVP